MRVDKDTGPAALAQLVLFTQSVGGPEQGEIVDRALEALIKGKKTDTREIDILVEYVRSCWTRGSRLGGLGGQEMWNFHYLLFFTKRPAQSFCKDPKFKAILKRPKYQQDIGHGKITDEDVGAHESDDLATSAFLDLFMKKVERLEKNGSETRFQKGKSCCPEMQWKKGESRSKETQWKKGESGSKETQWVSCGQFGIKGNAETYASMSALAKAIGRNPGGSGMSEALKRAKKKTPSSALRVDFKFAALELFWDKESGVGELA